MIVWKHLNNIDPLGLQTCLYTVRNVLGFGNHSALSVDADGGLLYDPSGGYAKEHGEISDLANLNDFIKYHHDEYDSVEKQCKNTSEKQEQKIIDEMLMRSTAAGPTCALNVSDVLNRSGALNGVSSGTFLPGSLSSDFGNSTVNNE